MQKTGITSHKHNSIDKNKLRRTWKCYFMLSPQLIGLLVFTLYPMFWAIHKSFYYYTGVPSETLFSGIKNFKNVFTDTVYWKTWLTTLQFSFIKLLIEFPLAMFLAIVLNKKIKGRGFFRALVYMPNIISVAIVGLMFTNMFDYFGFINSILLKLGFIKDGVYWLGSYKTAMAMLIMGSVWCGFGVNTLLFLAALQNVDAEVYESAYLDGAGRWTTFSKITLPLVAPAVQTIILLGINGTLHVSEYILATTNGAPGGQTMSVLAYQVGKFVPGFMDSATAVNLGYGCAMSMITSVIMCIIALAYNKLTEKANNIC